MKSPATLLYQQGVCFILHSYCAHSGPVWVQVPSVSDPFNADCKDKNQGEKKRKKKENDYPLSRKKSFKNSWTTKCNQLFLQPFPTSPEILS